MSATDTQVGGTHYKSLAIQPVEYIHANSIGYFEGNVIKYVTRWKAKGGIKDLEKAKHYIELLIEMESKELKPIESKQIESNDGWIDWDGGYCPVDGFVKIKRRGFENDNLVYNSWFLTWLHGKHEAAGEIIAYRVVPQPEA